MSCGVEWCFSMCVRACMAECIMQSKRDFCSSCKHAFSCSAASKTAKDLKLGYAYIGLACFFIFKGTTARPLLVGSLFLNWCADVARPDKISGADINSICQEVSWIIPCFVLCFIVSKCLFQQHCAYVFLMLTSPSCLSSGRNVGCAREQVYRPGQRFWESLQDGHQERRAGARVLQIDNERNKICIEEKVLTLVY